MTCPTEDPHGFERIALGPYRHRYDCRCGYTTDEADNGTPIAGAQLVRHLAATLPVPPE